MMGFLGHDAETIDTGTVEPQYQSILSSKSLLLNGTHRIKYDMQRDMVWRFDQVLPTHPNGMRFSVFDGSGDLLATNEYFSVGGGFGELGLPCCLLSFADVPYMSMLTLRTVVNEKTKGLSLSKLHPMFVYGTHARIRARTQSTRICSTKASINAASTLGDSRSIIRYLNRSVGSLPPPRPLPPSHQMHLRLLGHQVAGKGRVRRKVESRRRMAQRDRGICSILAPVCWL